MILTRGQPAIRLEDVYSEMTMMTTYTTKIWGETYEITADFAQASCPVHGDEHGRQVADFRHSPRAAMESLLREMVEMGGDDPDESADEINAALDAMIGRDADLIEMATMLERHGERFTGTNTDDVAQEWLDHDFDAVRANEWCEIGCWDAATAAELRDAGLTPDQAHKAAEWLTDGLDDAAEVFTDGDPIYSTCNGDTSVQEIVDAAKEIA